MWRAVAVGLVCAAAVGCADDDGGTGPRVAVPNTILADLVERVGCADPVDVVVGVPDDGVDPVIELSLDPVPDPSSSPAGPLVLPVAEAGDAIDTPTGADAWVWTDPIRYRQVAEAVGAALVSQAGSDPALIDRCLARIDVETTALDEELFTALDVLDPDERVLDIDAPGAVYFATRYEFAPSQLPAAIAAAQIVSVDDLGDAETYEDLMRTVVDGVIATLG